MDIPTIIAKCQQIVSINMVILDQQAKKPYETEWRNRYSNQCLAVILPQTVDQIQEIILFCQEHNIALIPQGGNTSLCCGSIPIPDKNIQLILNLSKLNKVIELNVANNSITLEAGCTLHQAQQAALNQGLYFPLSIGAEGSCQIGGNIATNAGGVHVIKYGMMRDLVLGLEVVLADGSVINQLNGLRKNNTNFDLKQLFIGSEGTLGVITKATLKLYPQPQAYTTGLIGVSNLLTAVGLLNTFKHKFNIAAFEIISQPTQEIYSTHFNYPKLEIKDEWLILFEFEVSSNTGTEDEIVQILNSFNLDNAIIASNEKEREQLWQIREQIPLAEKMNGFAVKHDIALPINNIEAFIKLNQVNILAKYPDAQIIIFGHLGDGNLHYNIQFKQRSYEELQKIEHLVNDIVYTDVQDFKGSFSAEHGIGYIKKSWFAKYYDPASYKLAYAIKQLLDPKNILNPGKIFKETDK